MDLTRQSFLILDDMSPGRLGDHVIQQQVSAFGQTRLMNCSTLVFEVSYTAPLLDAEAHRICPRCFPTKAISVWTATDDSTHAYIVGAYFHYSVPGGWTAPKAEDISPSKGGGLFGGQSDPMYVVYARKEV
jgi:hypothetical protein